MIFPTTERVNINAMTSMLQAADYFHNQDKATINANSFNVAENTTWSLGSAFITTSLVASAIIKILIPATERAKCISRIRSGCHFVLL